MKKITIKNLTGDVIGVNEIESSKVDEFLNNIKINSPYGKSEYQREVSPRKELEDGKIIEAVYETIPAEYTVEIEDITSEIEKLTKIKQIEELELQITPRRLREAVLSQDFSFIESIEQQIQAIRQGL